MILRTVAIRNVCSALLANLGRVTCIENQMLHPKETKYSAKKSKKPSFEPITFQVVIFMGFAVVMLEDLTNSSRLHFKLTEDLRDLHSSDPVTISPGGSYDSELDACMPEHLYPLHAHTTLVKSFNARRSWPVLSPTLAMQMTLLQGWVPSEMKRLRPLVRVSQDVTS